MSTPKEITRRLAIKSSVFGLVAVSIPNLVYGSSTKLLLPDENTDVLFHRYPSIDDKIVSEVVGVSHFNLERLKELVEQRPELARATWDWGFGDWESAIEAASHVGRRDIVAYLMSKGARPNLFTHAMLGNYDVVKTVLTTQPELATICGPHGISLLRHAEIGAKNEDLTSDQKTKSNLLVEYLTGLGNANIQPADSEMSAEVKEKYLGDYFYGSGEDDGFSIKINMRDMLSFGKLGKFGGGLFYQGNQTFLYNGVSSVQIIFELVDDKVFALTVNEPGLILRAVKKV